MKLNDKKVQSLIKAGQPGRFTDGDGLVLTISKAGRAYWQWRTTGPTGKETTISYPAAVVVIAHAQPPRSSPTIA